MAASRRRPETTSQKRETTELIIWGDESGLRDGVVRLGPPPSPCRVTVRRLRRRGWRPRRIPIPPLSVGIDAERRRTPFNPLLPRFRPPRCRRRTCSANKQGQRRSRPARDRGNTPDGATASQTGRHAFSRRASLSWRSRCGRSPPGRSRLLWRARAAGSEPAGRAGSAVRRATRHIAPALRVRWPSGPHGPSPAGARAGWRGSRRSTSTGSRRRERFAFTARPTRNGSTARPTSC